MAFPPNFDRKNCEIVRISKVFVLAGIMLAAAASAASAQFHFRTWSDRGVIYEEPLRELIGTREMRHIIFDYGYRIKGRLRRNGRVYVADVRDLRGRSFRLIVDGIHGDILQRFTSRAPQLRDRPQRRFSRGEPVGRPRALVPDVKKKSSQKRKARKAKRPRKALRTARKPKKTIIRRPLAPPIVPEKPAVAAKKPARAKPTPPVVQAAPKIIPDRANNAKPKPIIEKTELPPAAAPLLPPPVKPAPVKVAPPKKSAAVGNAGSTNARAVVAPLDNPGKRRDVEKPVAVAPLQ